MNKHVGPIALVRQTLEKLPFVKRTWFEWELEADGQLKTLVVEVSFDTDPNGVEFDSWALDHIRDLCKEVLENRTTMTIHRLRVIPGGTRTSE